MLTVILQNTNLQIINTRGGRCLLSSEMVEARKRSNPSIYRPDILHQCLLMLLDSPLNKSGYLRILVETTEKKVITINPHLRIPRVYSRFTGLLLQLLDRHRIYSENDRTELMVVSKHPLETHLDNTSVRVGMSQDGESFYEFMNAIKHEEKNSFCKLNTQSTKLSATEEEDSHFNNKLVENFKEKGFQKKTFLFYINAVASGDDPTEGMHHKLALSSYPLSAATCCSKICSKFEELWNVF